MLQRKISGWAAVVLASLTLLSCGTPNVRRCKTAADCDSGLICASTICASCKATKVCAAGSSCGVIADDGCGRQLDCGACSAGGTCSAVSPNVCSNPGCRPTTCATLGANCGSIGDGCGGVLTCGTCTTAGESCGGEGKPNVCGKGTCTAKPCEFLGSKTCGAPSDGCGSVLSCGTCTGVEACNASFQCSAALGVYDAASFDQSVWQ